MEMLSWASAEESVHMAEGYDKVHEGPRRVATDGCDGGL